MLEHLFIRTHVVARLRRGPLGPYLDDLATLLHQHGYARSSIQSYLRTGETFGRWLQGQGYALCEVDEAVLRCYVSGLKRYRSGHLPKAAEGPNHLFRFLQRQGMVSQRHVVGSPAPLEQWLAEYDAHLERVVGLAVVTRQGALSMARRFMASCFGTAAPDWPSVTAPMITAFVRRKRPPARVLAGRGRRWWSARSCGFWSSAVRSDLV